ncbi:MAG: hypothetical protein KTR32_42620 [Granulosicoccus sp.]|nr:hypothetical protein [Granulosicoccus sp.]
MTTQLIVPTEKSVGDILTSLYGKEVTTVAADPLPAADSFVSSYLCDEDKTVAVCLADYAAVGNAGGSLLMLPVGGIEDAVNDKDISKNMSEGFYEVVNVLSRVLMDNNSLHLRLDKLYPPGEATAVTEELGSDIEEMGFDITVQGYATGRISFQLA